MFFRGAVTLRDIIGGPRILKQSLFDVYNEAVNAGQPSQSPTRGAANEHGGSPSEFDTDEFVCYSETGEKIGSFDPFAELEKGENGV